MKREHEPEAGAPAPPNGSSGDDSLRVMEVCESIIQKNKRVLKMCKRIIHQLECMQQDLENPETAAICALSVKDTKRLRKMENTAEELSYVSSLVEREQASKRASTHASKRACAHSSVIVCT